MSRFDETAEQELREAFLTDRCGTNAYVSATRSCIRRSCLAFREEFPADSILNHTHTTEWVPGWSVRQRRCSVRMRRNRLTVLRAWWRWLFAGCLIDDNVLEFVSCEQLAHDALPRITLRHNLQRHIFDYLESRSDLAALTRKNYGWWLKRFNVFINQLPKIPENGAAKLDLGEDLLAAWFRDVTAQMPRATVVHAAAVLSTFIDHLVSTGVLTENALERLVQASPLGGRAGVVYALAAADRPAALLALSPSPRFRSHLASRFAGFLDLKRAAGCSERYGLSILRDFDRFLSVHGGGGSITSAVLALWWMSRPELGPSSRQTRWIVIRQFCLYVRRYLPETDIPEPLLRRLPPSRFRPRIVQPEEMKALLDAVTVACPGSRWPLRPHTYRTLLALLYTTGLRISEALHLQVDDVDLCERVLRIRKTKFYKSRLVPFSDGLLPILRDYQRERLRLLGTPVRDAAFFPTKQGGHYSQSSVNDIWQKLLRHTALGGGSTRGPRIHDLRHSAATLRLSAWYRKGIDVEAMLPRLATYLGHATVAATYRYLTILPETLLVASERFRHYSGAVIAPSGGNNALA